MRRDTLELAHDSLFVEKTNHAFAAAAPHLLARAHFFSKERASGLETTPFQAVDLHPDWDADALTVAGALLSPLIWQGHADPGEVRKCFSRTVTATLQDLSSPFILRNDSLNFT